MKFISLTGGKKISMKKFIAMKVAGEDSLKFPTISCGSELSFSPVFFITEIKNVIIGKHNTNKRYFLIGIKSFIKQYGHN